MKTNIYRAIYNFSSRKDTYKSMTKSNINIYSDKERDAEILDKMKEHYKLRLIVGGVMFISCASIRIIGWFEFPFLLFSIAPLI